MAIEPIKFGIEIEVEGPRLVFDGIGASWNTTADGSLRGNSVEYVLAGAQSSTDAKAALTLLHKRFVEEKAKTALSDRCGVHIHVNIRDMNRLQLCNFITVYLILEDALVFAGDEDRHDNLFCLRANSSEFLLNHLCQCFANYQHFRNTPENTFKYAAMNLAATRKFGSLEFRFFKTPSDFRKIKGWLDIFANIRAYSLTFGKPSDIVEAFSEAGATRFCQLALGDSFVYLSNMCNLEEIVWDSMRNMQYLAFSHKDQPVDDKPLHRDFGPNAGRINVAYLEMPNHPGLVNARVLEGRTFYHFWIPEGAIIQGHGGARARVLYPNGATDIVEADEVDGREE